MRTGGDPRNRDYLAGHVESPAAPAVEALCFDPQTSGGLLAAVDPAAAAAAEVAGFAVIGEVVAGAVPAVSLPRMMRDRGADRRSGSERDLWAAGHDVVVGIDEVGRGAWAGPLMVGAAVLPRDRASTRCATRRCSPRPSARAVRPHRRVVRRLGGRPRDPGGVRRARHGRRAAARRAAGDRGARRRARRGRRRRQLGLRLRAAPTSNASHGQGRRHLPVGRRGVNPRQGHPRPHHASRGRALPRLRLRREQGLPVPAAQGGAAGYGPSSIHRRTWVFMDHLPWPGLRVLRPEQAQLFEA